jgi:hypothetical protein
VAGPIHELSGEQYEVLFQIVYYGTTHGATGMEILAAVETGITEDALHNRNTATASNPAVGWRQEEPSYGSVADRLDLHKSIPNFYNEVKALRGRYHTSGELAQAVQRSAYPHRYAENEGLARTLIRELGSNRGRPGETFGPQVGSGTAGFAAPPTATPAVKGTELDYSGKVHKTGQRAGAHGSRIGGHARAIRAVASRNARL